MEGGRKRRKREAKSGRVNCYSVATVLMQKGAERHKYIRNMYIYSVSVMYGDSEYEEETPLQYLKWLFRYMGDEEEGIISAGGVNILWTVVSQIS